MKQLTLLFIIVTLFLFGPLLEKYLTPILINFH